MIYTPGGKFIVKGGKVVTDSDCCCDPCQTCTGSTCANCPDGITPNALTVLFGSVAATPRCVFITTGEPDPAKRFVWHLYCTLAGMSFTLAQSGLDPCRYELDVTGVVGVVRCLGDGSGCAACAGGTDVTVTATLVLQVGTATFPTPSVEVTYADAALGPGTLLVLFDDATHDPASRVCCETTTITLDPPSGFEDPISTIVSGGFAINPC